MSSTVAQSRQVSFFVVGGTLRRDALSYVQRQADRDLYNHLSEGKFCYVLTSRQIGKSSLMVRTTVRLREEGVAVAALDLTAIGQNLTAEQWYNGLLSRVGQQLDLEDELEDFWLDHERVAPFQRWMRAVRETVLEKYTGRVVIFIDEIDAVRSLPFSTDELFAGIREAYNRRAEDPDLNRLTFCLLGVATPSDLIRDCRTTPFNIGQRIELADFTEQQASQLAAGLDRPDELGLALIRRILAWTGGHPYLTQRLCLAVARDASVSNVSGVDRVCSDLFLSARAREQDDNLLFVRDRMLRGDTDIASVLDLYGKVRGNKRVKDDETDPRANHLRLSGATKTVAGLLKVRNRIYYEVFDKAWITANMPDAELRRQQAAYRRGFLRSAAVAAVLLAVVGLALIITTRQKGLTLQARNEAELQRDLANQKANEAERAKSDAEEQRTVAERERKIAEDQSAMALRQESIAKEQSRKASEARTMAEQRLAEAVRLRNDLDEAYWALVKDDPFKLRIYIAEYPRAKHVNEARQRLSALISPSASRSATGMIAGQVTDKTGTPLAGTNVIATNHEGNSHTAQTDQAGRFRLDDLPAGMYTVIASKAGFRTGQKKLIVPGDEKPIEFSLAPLKD